MDTYWPIWNQNGPLADRRGTRAERRVARGRSSREVRPIAVALQRGVGASREACDAYRSLVRVRPLRRLSRLVSGQPCWTARSTAIAQARSPVGEKSRQAGHRNRPIRMWPQPRAGWGHTISCGRRTD
jgi:hypothetical protein